MTIMTERRLQSGEIFRKYVDFSGYLIFDNNGEEGPIFLTPEGYKLSRVEIEQTADYIGFAEALLGLLPRKPNGEYMKGYLKAQLSMSRKLLPPIAGL